jgi:hypothetical protein
VLRSGGSGRTASARGLRDELVEMNAAEDSEFLDTLYDDLIAALQPGGRLRLGDSTA